jgi:two-component system alkaline phosphatase synthesis response regulator PhoP
MLTAPNFGFTVAKELPKRVLLVLLDEQQCLLVESALRGACFEVTVALERNNALKLMNEENPQVIIVDSALPDIGDILLCKRIRTELNMPETSVITLSEPQSDSDIPPAPADGVDADLQRPVAMEELLAKITELQSRHPATNDQRVLTLTVGAIKMVPEQWLAYVDGESVNLTEKEYRLLQELMEVRGRVLTRETLLERVWGHQKSFKLETRTLDVHMSRLRTKLGASASNIITVRNVGYRMNAISKLLGH